MDIVITKPLKKNSYAILRDAGYIPIFDRASGKQSYVFRIKDGRYPRFHVYVQEESDARTKWHMHLDQREHGFGERLHDTDYDGEAVKEEGARLQRWLAHYIQAAPAPSSKTPSGGKQDRRGFFSKLFGS
jgi:hypothetical protein